MRRAMLLLLAALLAVGPAGAQPVGTDAQARTHFKNGRAHYQRGQYAQALAEFQAGFDLSGRPVFLFNMGECARLAGDTGQARALYRRYLEAAPAGELAASARARLEALGPEPIPPPTAPPPPIIETQLPAPAPQPPPPVLIAPVVDRPATGQRRPLYRRWPFWAIVGGIVVGGSLAAYALTRSGDDCASCPVVDLR